MTRPRVLVCATLQPDPPDRGDKVRLLHELRLLSEIADVHLLSIGRAWERDDRPGAQPWAATAVRVGKWQVVAGMGLATLRGRSHLAWRYDQHAVRGAARGVTQHFAPDVVWGYQITAWPLVCATRVTRVVFDLVDSPTRFQAAASLAADTLTLEQRVRLASDPFLAGAERAVVKQSAALFVNSPLDLAHMRDRFDATRATVLENCVPAEWLDARWEPTGHAANEILFVGNLHYAPNAVGLQSFAAGAFQAVRRVRPDVRLRVVGRGPERTLAALRTVPGVDVAGFVADLRATYARARLAVVPIPFAGGSQYKLLEAMALGVPTVTSAAAAEVLGIQDGVHSLVARDAAAETAQVLRLLDDHELAQTVSTQARAFIAAHHVWEGKRDVIATALRAALA